METATLLAAHGYGLPDADAQVGAEAAGGKFYEMDVPWNVDAADLYGNFAECLRRVL